MEKTNRDTKKQVTLEDLLKLKRAERPDKAFWNSFERELHKKAIQKIVYKPSLRHRLFSAISNFSAEFRHVIPVGAAALLTIGLFTYSQKLVVHNGTGNTQVPIIERIMHSSSSELAVADLSSIKTNFVKNSVASDANDARCYANRIVAPGVSSASGVRYLAGSVASANLATGSSSNMLF